MNEEAKEVDYNIPQPEFTLNSVTVTADSVEYDLEISEEV
jgi:hypothetical protein